MSRHPSEMKCRSEIESQLSWRPAKWRLRLRFRTLTLSPLPAGRGKSQSSQFDKQTRPSQDRPTSPYARGSGVSGGSAVEDEYPHLPQRRESPKRKASISHRSKAAGLKEQFLPKMLLRGARHASHGSGGTAQSQRNQSSSRPMRRIVGERMTQEQTERAAFLHQHGHRHDARSLGDASA